MLRARGGDFVGALPFHPDSLTVSTSASFNQRLLNLTRKAEALRKRANWQCARAKGLAHERYSAALAEAFPDALTNRSCSLS